MRVAAVGRRGKGAGRVMAAAILIVATWAPLAGQDTGLTIYQDGRVVVRRAFAVAVPRGASSVAVDLGARTADVGSLVALDEGVTLKGARLSAATGLEAAMRRAVGQEIEFLLSGDSLRFVRATVLSLEPPAFRLGGRVLFEPPGRPALPESLLQLAPQVRLDLESARALPALRLAYLAQGVRWRASYTAVLDRSGRAAIAGSATIENPGALSFGGAEVQLLAGEVRRAEERAPRPRAPYPFAMEAAAAGPPTEEAVGETHLYTLPARVDIVPGETRTVALFPRAEAPAEPVYLLRPSRYGYISRWPGAEPDVHAEVSYLVRRPATTAFGAVPLPAGVVRVFLPDTSQRLQLVGEVSIGHTPAGREVHLTTGTAFDLTAQRTQLTFEPGRREAISSYRVTIQNAKPEGVTVRVLDEFPGRWEVLSSSSPPERLSASTVRFAVPVPAGGEATLEYRIRVRW